ncbi:hypothetical protein U27_02268 [Candidatus Vecturithrix granuli]|uniref:Uncharacterized protein n=1 Tax=Vecturithrix granuli TaxID=1499967 RepID=A0A0S6WAW3_VECG1|nr:hypothetical protein U27_02268 [Candidatus Vecturithrix granuli]
MNFNMVRCTIFVCGCILLLISSPLEAQPIPALESDALGSSGFARVFPESTLAVMVVPQLQATNEILQHYISTLALIKSLQPFLQSISIGLQKFEDSSGIHLADIGSIFQTSFAIALLDVEIPEMTQNTSWTFPEVALAAEVANSAETLQYLLKRVIHTNIQLPFPSVQFQTRMVHGITLWSVSNSQFRFAYTFLDHVFLLTTNPEYLELLIATRQHSANAKSSNTFKSLYNADVYSLTRQVITQYDHDVCLYVNIHHIWRKLHEAYHEDCTPSPAAETQKDSLLCVPPPLRSLTWLFSLKENGGYERIFWEMNCQDDQPTSPNCMFWSHLQATENGLLISDQLVPANILYYHAWQFDSSGWWQRWKHYLDLFLPVSDREDIDLQIQKLEQTLQLRVEFDILPAFGHEIAIACYDPSRQLYVKGQEASMENFPCILFIQVDQRERIEYLIQSMAAIPLSKNTIQGMSVYQLDFPGNITPIRVYAAFIHDFLTITSSQRGLQQIISVAQQGGSLAFLPDYITLSALFAKECYAKSYFNLRYFLQRADPQHTSAIRKPIALPVFLTGLFSVTTRTSSGMLTESFSTLGGTIVGTGVILWCILNVW